MTARIVIDTREQRPLDFGSVPTVLGTIGAGDYSIEGVTDRVAVERKSKADMYGCIGAGRDRFQRCLGRLAALDRSAVVIECALSDFKNPPTYLRRREDGRGYEEVPVQISPAKAIHSCISWQVQYGVPFVWVDSREDAAAWIYQFLARWVKHRLGENNAGTGGA